MKASSTLLALSFSSSKIQLRLLKQSCVSKATESNATNRSARERTKKASKVTWIIHELIMIANRHKNLLLIKKASYRFSRLIVLKDRFGVWKVFPFKQDRKQIKTTANSVQIWRDNIWEAHWWVMPGLRWGHTLFLTSNNNFLKIDSVSTDAVIQITNYELKVMQNFGSLLNFLEQLRFACFDNSWKNSTGKFLDLNQLFAFKKKVTSTGI